MNIFYFILGILILLFRITDLVWTTLWTDDSAGPFSAHYTRALWHAPINDGQEFNKALDSLRTGAKNF